MSRHFTAVLLLDQVVPLDLDGLAKAVAAEFPEIGEIEAVVGHVEGEDSGLLRIDGGNVVVTLTPEPFPEDQFSPELQVQRSWESDDAIRGQKAHVTLTCGGRIAGLEGAEAYAAAVHFVAAALTRLLPVTAVFWQQGYVLSEPTDFHASARKLLGGRMPLGAWISFATIVPKGFSKDVALGIVTYGMRPFIGREIELAPRPGTPRAAYECVAAVARDILDRGTTLVDGQQFITGGEAGFGVTVRERTFWLRRDLSAFVLVSDDAVVEAETLRPRERPAA